MESLPNDRRVRLSVVIPTYNRGTLLSRTLPTILQQSCPPETYEVIVVIDGSTDGTIDLLGRFHPSCAFRVLSQQNKGQAAAQNAGLGAARGDLVLFLDDDLICDPDLVTEHIAGHETGEGQVVFGPNYVSPESPPTLATSATRRMTNIWFGRLRQEGARLPLDAYVTPNTSAQRTVLLAHGGFDDTLFGRDRVRVDLDLGLRLWLAGLRFRFQPGAVTHQVYIKSNRDMVHGDGPAYGRGEVALFRKHPVYRKHFDLRRHSEFAPYTDKGAGKKLAADLAARVSLPFDLAASVPCWVGEHLPEGKLRERLGLRFLVARRIVAMLRTAVGEAGGWKAFEREFGILVPTLLYHNVGPRRSGAAPTLNIPPAQFERQIRWLKRRGYVGIRSSDWLSWLHDKKRLPGKPIIITFDDAYADISEYALPTLKRHGFSATVFVVTREIGGSNVWDQNKASAIPCMTAEQIREWAAQGFEFGSHTRTHKDLRTVDDAGLAEEVGGSEKDLADLLGIRTCSFAYPYGHYSENIRTSLEQIYDLAFTCDEGVNGFGTDPLLLRRVMVRPNDTLVDLYFYAKIGHTPINHLRDAWHRIRSARRPAEPKETAVLPLQ